MSVGNTLGVNDRYKYNLVTDEAHSSEKSKLDKSFETVTLAAPPDLSYYGRDNFVQTLISAPNVKRLEVKPILGWRGLLLEPLTEYLKANFPKLLTHVTVYTLKKCPEENSIPAEVQELLMQELFQKFIAVLGHPQLESVKIYSKKLTDVNLPSLLEASSNFRKLTLCIDEGSGKDKLMSLKMRNCHEGALESFEGLKECKKLRAITCERQFPTEDLLKFLFSKHRLDLQVLDMQDTQLVSTDYDLFKLTKNLPNLLRFQQSHFVVNNNHITDEGLALFATNCPKLAYLELAFENISEEGFVAFVHKATNLQVLHTYQGYNLKENALIAIGTLKDLTSLSLVHFNRVTLNGLLAIARGCPKLEAIEISCCNFVSIEDLACFIKEAPQVKMISFLDASGKLEKLKDCYPHIQFYIPFRMDSKRKLNYIEAPQAQTVLPLSQNAKNRFLLDAVRHGNEEDVEKYLQEGAVADSVCVYLGQRVMSVTFAALKGNLALLRRFQAHGVSFKACEAILGNLSQPHHVEVLRFLLENGCSPDAIGAGSVTPLQAMASGHHLGSCNFFSGGGSKVSLDCIKTLVAAGADISVLHRELSLADLTKLGSNRAAYAYFTQELGIKEDPTFSMPEELPKPKKVKNIKQQHAEIIAIMDRIQEHFERLRLSVQEVDHGLEHND